MTILIGIASTIIPANANDPDPILGCVFHKAFPIEIARIACAMPRNDMPIQIYCAANAIREGLNRYDLTS